MLKLRWNVYPYNQSSAIVAKYVAYNGTIEIGCVTEYNNNYIWRSTYTSGTGSTNNLKAAKQAVKRHYEKYLNNSGLQSKLIPEKRNKALKLAEELIKPLHNEALMQQWDKWRRMILESKGSLPRDCFEALIATIDEEREEAGKLIRTLLDRK